MTEEEKTKHSSSPYFDPQGYPGSKHNSKNSNNQPQEFGGFNSINPYQNHFQGQVYEQQAGGGYYSQNLQINNFFDQQRPNYANYQPDYPVNGGYSNRPVGPPNNLNPVINSQNGPLAFPRPPIDRVDSLFESKPYPAQLNPPYPPRISSNQPPFDPQTQNNFYPTQDPNSFHPNQNQNQNNFYPPQIQNNFYLQNKQGNFYPTQNQNIPPSITGQGSGNSSYQNQMLDINSRFNNFNIQDPMLAQVPNQQNQFNDYKPVDGNSHSSAQRNSSAGYPSRLSYQPGMYTGQEAGLGSSNHPIAQPISVKDQYGTNGNNIRFTNINENQLVHQRFIIIHGSIVNNPHKNGKVSVLHPYFPTMVYDVVEGFFKAIVELEGGENNITFVFNNEKTPETSENLCIRMKPNLEAPPLNLVMVIGKDSIGKFDFDPSYPPKSDDYLDLARRKLICTAYLWQAFIAEQMRRAGYGFRTIRFEEEYVEDTMTNRDNYKRMNAKVHIIKSELTVKEIRHKDRSQQYKNPSERVPEHDDSQFDIATRALRSHGGPFADNGTRKYIAALSLDSTWDPEERIALGHAALGGSTGEYRLGVFGSHLTFSWPSCLEEVIPCMNDTTKVNTSFLSDDGNWTHEYWRSANVGMGAFLHEVGHLMTMPHTPTGIMYRGFDNLNRTFNVSEPGNEGPILVSDEDGAHFHMTDLARLRYHPLTKFDGEESFDKMESGIEAYYTDNGIIVSSNSGIHLVEAWVRDCYRYHYDYCSENFARRANRSIITGSEEERAVHVPRAVTINYSVLEQLCCHTDKENPIYIKVTSRSKDDLEVHDLKKQILESRIECPNGLLQYSTVVYGSITKELDSALFLGDSYALQYPPNSHKFQSQNNSEIHRASQIDLFPPQLKSIRVIFHKSYSTICALQVELSNGESSILGNINNAGIKSHLFEIPANDGLASIFVRSGQWIDGFEFTTRLGVRSGLIGGTGGSGHLITAPEHHVFTGIKACADRWLDGFSAQYSRI
ncbi:putative zinc metalloproteinase [Smittium culicis]|uniref:Putative zinc metalloproteinase n=1 Tax=Smittium culicis TaxID=133412 RepID=A0A1R1XIE0_9FUNG|nr:putative zinc metalloproteinase [Smittium culicis]